MMHIKEINNHAVSAFFLGDPKLCLMGLPDGHLYYLNKFNKYPSFPEETTYGLYEKDILIAVVMFEEYNKDTLTMHFYLSTNNLRKDVVVRFYSTVEDMLRKNYSHTKVAVFIPESCVHVQKVVQAIGFKFKETVKEGITWRGIVESLDIYETRINREIN